MRFSWRSRSQDIRALARRLSRFEANLSIEAPGLATLRSGARPDATRVIFHTRDALSSLLRGDHLGLAEAFLEGRIDILGDLVEALKATRDLSLDASLFEQITLGLRQILANRFRYEGDSIAFHYDRPAEFFLPWLGRWRCYSHGLYLSERDTLDSAMARKMQHAIEALGLRAGMHVLDMGSGWGCFVEYAGLQGISVHAITLSEVQYQFVERLIQQQKLPCTVELAHFRRWHPPAPLDGAVFMGSFEHNPEYEFAAHFLARNLRPGGRIWTDFCAQRTAFTPGRFMKKHLWPGPTSYVNPYRLIRAFVRAGFNVHELHDDTRSYACTVRDWGDAFETGRKALAERFGEPAVRAFLLFLRGSLLFLRENRTQAYHLVAGREAAVLPARCVTEVR